jgi:hypothetical protein
VFVFLFKVGLHKVEVPTTQTRRVIHCAEGKKSAVFVCRQHPESVLCVCQRENVLHFCHSRITVEPSKDSNSCHYSDGKRHSLGYYLVFLPTADSVYCETKMSPDKETLY